MPLTYLKQEQIKAMKNKDNLRKSVLIGILDACQKATITNKGRVELTDELVNETLLKYQKMMQEMVDTCPKNRQDLLESYTAQLTIVNEYAPKVLTDEKEIENYIKSLDIELNKANKGALMKVLKGNVDMKVANKVVNALCQ